MMKFPRSCLLSTLIVLSVARVAQGQVNVKIGSNFPGVDNSNLISPFTGLPTTPADGNGAVGVNYFVEFVNGSFTVYNKSDGSAVVQITDMDFWSNAGPNGGGVGGINFSSSDAISDPRVIYDPSCQRWFASQVKFNATVADPSTLSDYYLLGVSDTDDPSGAWHVFSFLSVTGAVQFADFPTLGVDASAVYLAGDMYHGETTTLGSSLTMLPKADLLANPAVISHRILFKTAAYTNRGAVLQPATCVDGSSSGNILAVGSVADDFITHSNIVATTMFHPGATNAALAPSTNILVGGYDIPTEAMQPDATQTLPGAYDARMSARVYTVGGIIYACHNIEVNGHGAIRWYRLNAANYALLEQGTITDPNLDLIYASIAANSNGVVVIACNGCSINTYISSYAYAGLTVNGQTTFGNPILLAAGSYNYHDLYEQSGSSPDGDSRWGDYSTISVDPVDSTHFWTIQMLPLYSFDYDLFDSGDAVIWQMQITELITSVAAPPLTISLTGTNAVVSWPLFASSYQLFSATNLTSPVAWSSVTNKSITNGPQISVMLPHIGKQTFFRLQK
jgi:hypothetical protein